MGALVSCFGKPKPNAHDAENTFKRRTVSKSELMRPLTKRLAYLNILNPNVTNPDNILNKPHQKSNPISSQSTHADTDNNDHKYSQQVHVSEADKSSQVEKNLVTGPRPRIDEVNTASLVSESEDVSSEPVSSPGEPIDTPIDSIRKRISAFENFENSPSDNPSSATLEDNMHENPSGSDVKRKIAKYNWLDQMAIVDDEAAVKSGDKRNLVVKKSDNFLSKAAVFENPQIVQQDAPISDIALAPNKKHGNENKPSHNRNKDTGRKSPSHVAGFLSADT